MRASPLSAVAPYAAMDTVWVLRRPRSDDGFHGVEEATDGTLFADTYRSARGCRLECFDGVSLCNMMVLVMGYEIPRSCI